MLSSEEVGKDCSTDLLQYIEENCGVIKTCCKKLVDRTQFEFAYVLDRKRFFL